MKFYCIIKIVFVCFLIVMQTECALCISAKQEEEIGREFVKYITKHVQLIQDPFLLNYVNQVGSNIVSVTSSHLFDYNFYIIKSDAYNAFAVPGGHVFINSGLIEAMESENELAGIFAHEIAHVTCRHISQRMEKTKKIGLATLAGIAAGIFLGINGSEAAASALTIGSIAASQSMFLAYSREDELQADQIGLTYLVKAGYSGQGLITSLKKIRKKQWFGSKQIPTYLSTHPATEERIGLLDALNANYAKKSKQINNSNKNKDTFKIAHMRLLALYGDEKIIMKQFAAKAKKNPSNYMNHYGYGLILARTGNTDNAIKQLKKALEKKAFDSNILTDLGKIYFFKGCYKEALNLFENAISIKPDNYESLRFWGHASLEYKNYDNAIYAFQKIIEKKNINKKVLFLIAQTYAKQGKIGQAHYYLGFYYYTKMKMKKSRFYLKKALNQINDSSKKEHIMEMLNSINKQLK